MPTKCPSFARYSKSKRRCISHLERKDFKVVTETRDPRIPYIFESKDGSIEANFFWMPNDVEVRGLVGDTGTLHFKYPMLNYRGQGTLPKPTAILDSIIRAINRGQYEY